MLDVIRRSQRARICEYKRGNAAMPTPFVISSDSSPIRISVENGSRQLDIKELIGQDGGTAEECSVPMDPDILMPATSREPQEVMFRHGICVVRSVSGNLEIPKDTEIIVLPNGAELRNDARKLIDTITTLRKKAGHGVLIYVSGIAEPSTLALLTYMGADVFDDVLPRAFGSNSIRCIPEGHIASDDDTTEDNIKETERECSKVKEFIKAGRLRELVDQRASSSPFATAVLRLLDKTEYEYMEEACDTAGGRFACNTTQSLFRPEVMRFRKKIISDYIKPAHKKVLVLLPCSARKPYHTSRSHKAFASAIHTGDHDIYVHEVIVTSPLGAVPRELDVFFPANAYDIPVTGEWKCQEKSFIRELVSHIIGMGYDKVISHLGDSTDEMISDLCAMERTCVGDPVSPASLKNLESAVKEAAKKYPRETYNVERTETMRSILSFQFSREAADKIMEGSHVTGKFPYWKLFRGKDQIGMLTPERQMVSFTIEGAEILASSGINTVEMMDFEIKGNLFAVGVADADETIRIGDEAVITLNGKVKAVGVAQMSGKEMKDLSRGIAVKVRHKS